MRPPRYFPPKTTTPKEPKPRLSKAERLKQQQRKDKNHDAYVAKTYGLARGDYADLLASQSGVCAICGKRPRARKLAVDHDHFDQRVRGLLCFMCNSALGTFEFDPDTARRARDYLDRIVHDFAMRPPLVEDDSPVKRGKVRVRIEEQGDLPF